MQAISQCSQYYPYANKTDPCHGNVHKINIQWEVLGNFPYPQEIEGILVCDGHMESFIGLGQREDYQYRIKKDSIIGTISPSIEGQPLSKERECYGYKGGSI